MNEILNENEVLNKAELYLKESGYSNIQKYPPNSWADMVAVSPKNESVFIEAKGTIKVGGNNPWPQGQNKNHFHTGLWQLMTRIKSENDIGILFLPYHLSFVNLIKQTETHLKKLGFHIYFVYKDKNPEKIL